MNIPGLILFITRSFFSLDGLCVLNLIICGQVSLWICRLEIPCTDIFIHMFHCICLKEAFQVKFKPQHTGVWLTTTRPPRRPAVFHCHFRLTGLSLTQRMHFGVYQMLFQFFDFVNCVSLKLRNLKLSKSGSVCIWINTKIYVPLGFINLAFLFTILFCSV